MNNVGRHLQSGERLIYLTRLHWIVFMEPLILVALGFAIAFNPATNVLGGILALIGFAWGELESLQYSASIYALTNWRVVARFGPLHRSPWTMPLSQIESVWVDRSRLGRALNFGTLFLVGAGGAMHRFADVDGAAEFGEQIRAQLGWESL